LETSKKATMNKARKVFITINIDEKVKKYINSKIDKIRSTIEFVNLARPENYHFTILYIGFIDDEELVIICNKIKKALYGIRAFDFSLDSFFWGPKKENPKMLWITGKKNKELANLKYSLENALNENDFEIREKEFKPHINLGRIIKRLAGSGKEFNKIKERININIPVSGVEIMESIKEKGKNRYYILERVKLLE